MIIFIVPGVRSKLGFSLLHVLTSSLHLYVIIHMSWAKCDVFTLSLGTVLECGSTPVTTCPTNSRASKGIMTWLLPINAVSLESGFSAGHSEGKPPQTSEAISKGLRDPTVLD